MEPQNREQRRHPEQLDPEREDAGVPPREASPSPTPDDQMRGDDRVQDDLSVRAKNSGHGKKTADKWNQ
jgi:hypothetical protein